MNWDSLANNSSSTLLIISILFFLLTYLGFLTLLQLVRLRVAWYESAKAMNHIKDYYCKNYADLNFHDAFLWSKDTIPDMYKPDSVGYYLAVQVVVLSSATLAAGIVFFARSRGLPDSGLILGGLTGFISLTIIFLYRYRQILVDKQEEEKKKSTKN